jgi:hypothetical protein
LAHTLQALQRLVENGIVNLADDLKADRGFPEIGIARTQWKRDNKTCGLHRWSALPLYLF